MAYRVTIPITLGLSQTGLTLTARLFDTDDVQVGLDITTGFTEIGSGNYAWDYASIPVSFRGWVKFYSGATLMAFTTLVPEDVELVSVMNGLAIGEVVASISPVVTAAGDLNLVKGQDYLKRTENQIEFTDGSAIWPNLANASVIFHAFDEEFEMEVLSLEDPKQVGLDLEGTDTEDLVLTRYSFYVSARLTDGTRNILARGRVVFT